MMIFFRDRLAVALNKGFVKFLVIVCFMIYLGIGIYGCTQVKEGLDRRKLSRDDSYSVRYYDYEDRFFREYPYRIQVVINDTLNYADPVDQAKVEKMLQKFEDSDYVANKSLTESWLRAYLEFLNQEDSFIFLQALNISDKEDFYRGLRDIFLKFPLTEAFRNDVIFNEDGTEIIASRYVIQTHNIEDANMEKDMLIALRQIASDQPLNVTIFHQLFIFFDQFILVREISLQTITVAAIVMMVISLLFIPSPSCAIWVAFSIISIEVGVVGYMTLWNVNLDSISMINLIMCIGFSVDFSAHISYAYISCEEDNAADRVRSALYSLGLPIFQGSVSTILGIIALAFAPSYVFLVFFKTVFLVMLFGALHGVLLLPVLLSLTDVCRGSKPKRLNKIHSLRKGNSRNGYKSSSNHHLNSSSELASIDNHHPSAFMISEKSFGDGKMLISQNINPIFIPRPSITNEAPLEKEKKSKLNSKTAITVNGKVIDEDSGQCSKSSASSETESGSREKDYGLGTSGEECSEGSWKGKKEAEDIVIESETQIPTIDDGVSNAPHHPRPADRESSNAPNMYSKWSKSRLNGANGHDVFPQDHINFGYISDPNDQDNYEIPMPQRMNSTASTFYPDNYLSRSSRNDGRLSAYDALGSNRIGGWSRQLITTPIPNGSNSFRYPLKIESEYGDLRHSKHRPSSYAPSQISNSSSSFYHRHEQESRLSHQDYDRPSYLTSNSKKGTKNRLKDRSNSKLSNGKKNDQ